jgi:hypothetical protein
VNHTFARLIVNLINVSLDSGFFRNVSRLLKVFEKVVYSQLNGIIDVDFIDENQFGFRNNHRTEDTVVKFVNKLKKT